MTTVGEAVKKLTKAGFKQLNQVGSHIKYGLDSKRITIVMRKSLKEELNKSTERDLKLLLNGSK